MSIRKGEAWAAPVPPGTPVTDVVGDDASLAAAVAAARRGALLGGRDPAADDDGPVPPVVRFRPSAPSDLGRTLGLPAAAPDGPVPRRRLPAPPQEAVACDALQLAVGADPGPHDADPDHARLAVAGVAMGTPPHRVTRWSGRRGVRVEVDGRLVHEGRALAVVVTNAQFLAGANVAPRGHPGDGRVEVQVYDVAGRERAELRRRLGSGAHLPHPRIVTATGRTVAVTWARPVPVLVDGRPGAPSRALAVTVVPGAFRVAL